MNERAKKVRKELGDLLDDRHEIVGEIQSLKNKKADIEHKVKNRIIDAGQLDLLSVNWGRVHRSRYR